MLQNLYISRLEGGLAKRSAPPNFLLVFLTTKLSKLLFREQACYEYGRIVKEIIRL